MKISFDEIELNVLIDEKKLNENLQPIIFLHGFTGSANDWQNIIPQIDSNFLPVAIDLIGHGKSSLPADSKFYSAQSIAFQIKSLIEKLKLSRPIICGYSMGGRAALSYAVCCPENFKALILESSSPGIINDRERNEREKSDRQLADTILKDGIEKFVDHWMNIPLFKTQESLPPKIIEQIKKEKLKNNPTGLANSLLGFSAGVMPNYYPYIHKIIQPTLLITGALDQKFTDINSLVNGKIINSRHEIVQGAGHNVHLERPEDFVTLVNQFLSNLI